MSNNNVTQLPAPAPYATERTVTQSVIDGFIENHPDITFADLLSSNITFRLVSEFMSDIEAAYSIHNVVRKGGDKLTVPKTLPVEAAVQIIAATNDVRVGHIGTSRAIFTRQYNLDGQPQVVWSMVDTATDENTDIKTTFYNLMGLQTKSTVITDAIRSLWGHLDSRENRARYTARTTFPHWLVPCANGVYDRKEQTFHAVGTPDYIDLYDRYTFTYCLDTPYIAGAACPAYFDPIAWIKTIVDMKTPIGRATFHILLDTMKFAIMNYSGGSGYTVYLNNVADKVGGQNGKSTWADLTAFIIDHTSCPQWTGDPDDLPFRNGKKVVRCSIDRWGDRFSLGKYIRTCVMLVSDEAKNSKAIDNVDVLKNFARRQPIQFEIKHRDPFEYTHMGVKLHLQNEITKYVTKDKATYTHNIYLTMDQDFRGRLDDRIKKQYVVDEAVAEYMLAYLLESDYKDDYDPDDIAAVQPNTEAIIKGNMPIFTFLDEFLEDLYIPAYSSSLLHAAYMVWARKNGFCEINKIMFNRDMLHYVAEHEADYEWLSTSPRYAKGVKDGDYKAESSMVYDLLRGTSYCNDKAPQWNQSRRVSDEYVNTMKCANWLVRR